MVRWGKSTDKAFAEYISNLATDWSEIKEQESEEAVLAILKQRMDEWIVALQQGASKYIDDLGVLTRETAHQYYLPLWLWHRLDADRWKASSLPLREQKN